MSHIYKAEEWQSGSGKWFVNDVSDLGNDSGKWWHQYNIIGATPDVFIDTLINKYHAGNFSYSRKNDLLIFSFDNQTYARKYKNDLNKMAREKKYMI